MTAGEVVQVVALIAGAYLVGSLPVGWLVCRLGFNINILDHGSGRSGTTNVYRTVGAGAALIAFVGDLLKGFLPALVARFLFFEFPLVPMLVAIISTVGHNWSIFLGLRGGRGVVTSWGSVMALIPIAAVVGIPIGLVTVAIGRYVSLGSLAGAIGFLVGSIVFYAMGPYVSGFDVTLIAIFVVFLFSQHLDNLRRLFSGTERRLPPWSVSIGSRGVRDG